MNGGSNWQERASLYIYKTKITLYKADILYFICFAYVSAFLYRFGDLFFFTITRNSCHARIVRTHWKAIIEIYYIVMVSRIF